MLKRRSITQKITLWSGGLTILVFTLIVALTSLNFRTQLEKTIYHDLLTRNISHVQTIFSILEDRKSVVLALRDDLELYETLGQMWVHLAAHTGTKVFSDPDHGEIYSEAFEKKLEYYLNNGQLSDDKLTPQLRTMLDRIDTSDNAFGDGMKFFYIGLPEMNGDTPIHEYDRYQDSSLWVPTPRVDQEYDPLVRPWYIAGQHAGRDRIIFTEPYAERRTGEALISAATSISVQGTQGSFAAAISIQPIMDEILRDFSAQAHITIFSKGVESETIFEASPPKYIYSSRDSSIGANFPPYDDAELIKEQANSDLANLYDATRDDASGVIEWSIDGSPRLVAFHTAPVVGWKIFTSVSQKQTMRDALVAQFENIVISIIGLLMLLGILHGTTKRALAPLDTMQRELTEIANTGDLSKRISVSSRDEVGQMADALNAMLDNTAGPVRELGRHVKRIADGHLEGRSDIKAKGDIAQLVASFDQMSERLIEFEQSSLDASPLTGLPGGVSIETEVQNRIQSGMPFSFCIFDLDNFKPYNDLYGYSRGNFVIQHTARLICNAMQDYGTVEDFCGHIGGDDFVLITSPESAEIICQAVIADFDATIAGFYDPTDDKSNAILSKDRLGRKRRFPIMTITACAVSSERTAAKGAQSIGEAAAKLKRYGKQKSGSTFISDEDLEAPTILQA